MKLETLEQVASAVRSLMDGFPAPWYVAGGWALDLFLGRVTRPHADLEIAVFREDQALLHPQRPDWEFVKIVRGRPEPWRENELLSLPVHEIHGCPAGEPTRGIELLLNERDAGNWVFRRNPAIVLPLSRAGIVSELGVPALSPEIVLIFKAKSPRARDEADFDEVRVAMEPSRRRWLREALRVCDPDHAWIPRLDAGGTSPPSVGPGSRRRPAPPESGAGREGGSASRR